MRYAASALSRARCQQRCAMIACVLCSPPSFLSSPLMLLLFYIPDILIQHILMHVFVVIFLRYAPLCFAALFRHIMPWLSLVIIRLFSLHVTRRAPSPVIRRQECFTYTMSYRRCAAAPPMFIPDPSPDMPHFIYARRRRHYAMRRESAHDAAI